MYIAALTSLNLTKSSLLSVSRVYKYREQETDGISPMGSHKCLNGSIYTNSLAMTSIHLSVRALTHLAKIPFMCVRARVHFLYSEISFY